jgi:NAD+ synthase (glutamine-hydrolysing)
MEERKSPQELTDNGNDPILCQRVMGLLRRAELKLRQVLPVPKVSQRAFGIAWRMPIAAKS